MSAVDSKVITWGLKPPFLVRDNVRAAWGARALFDGRLIDLLWDRQSAAGPEVDRKELAARIDDAMRIVTARARRLFDEEPKPTEITLGDMVVRMWWVGGYLYMGAHLIGEPRPSLRDEATGCYAEYEGGKVTFRGGNRGEHSIWLAASSNERILAHFGGYCERGGSK